MKKNFVVVLSIQLLVFFLFACNPGTTAPGSIAGDSATIASGEKIFNTRCIGCHNFRQDGIGPQLSGLTAKVSPAWIKDFIKDPQKLITARDDSAWSLYQRFKTVMPSFTALNDDELNGIVAFIHTHKARAPHDSKKYGNAIANPVPQPVRFSGLVVGLKLLTQIPASSDSSKKPLARITQLSAQPGTGNLFVVDLRGKLYRVLGSKPVVYLDIASQRPQFIGEPGLATGFGSFAFHPDFLKNGIFYTTHSEAAASAKADFAYADSIPVTLQWVLTEWKAKDPNALVFAGTSRELLRVNMVSSIHGVQQISFDPFAQKGSADYGLLYVSIGDGGAVENGYPFLAHDKEKIWGSIIRLNPFGTNSKNGKYGIPASNPFAHDKDSRVLGEIYAYGFRNPHRFSWNSSGNMIACNIGQSNIEAVDVIIPGHDYGWPLREGNFLLDPFGDLSKVYALPGNDSVYKFTYPVAEYDHDEGKAISGGFDYEGRGVPALRGKYVFGDIPTGRLFYVDMADIAPGRQAPVNEWKVSLHGEMSTLKDLCTSNRVDLHFGRDAEGELYILTKADGKIYKLVAAKK